MSTPVLVSKHFSASALNALKYPTPFILFDTERVEKNYQNLRSALKNAQIFYALKANPDMVVARRLLDLGASFEIASLNELHLLRRVGVNPQDVMYSNPVKPASHIKGAFELGLSRFAFDTSHELEKLAHFAPGSSVYLRMAVNDKDSTFPLSKKFGADPQDAVMLLKLARELGLKPYGLTFHVGSQSLNPNMWESAIAEAGTVMRKLQQEGITLEMLDIGGGFPADYGEERPALQEIGDRIHLALQEYLPYPVTLAAEPGRSMIADAAVIAATVIGRADRGGKHWLYLDVGAFNGLMEPLETANRFIYPMSTSLDEREGVPMTPYTLTGPTCDTQDTIYYDFDLPANIEVGDRLYFHSAGAYTTAYASSFNGFGPPDVRYVDKRKD